MHHGLSPLQVFILTTAHRNRIAEAGQQDAPQVDLYYHEVLAGYFRFPVAHLGDYLRWAPGTHRLTAN